MVLPSRKARSRAERRRFWIRRGTTISLIAMLWISIYLMALDFLGSYHWADSNDNMNGPPNHQVPDFLAGRERRRDQHPPSRSSASSSKNWLFGGISSNSELTPSGRVKVDVNNHNEALKVVLSASVHLIDIRSDARAMTDSTDDETYSGITAEFCALDFKKQRRDPSSVPMFRQLVASSRGCQSGTHYEVDLKSFVRLAREKDQEESSKVQALPLRGVVFHESRCGSTLVANAMVAMNPTGHRVYSESAPPIEAIHTVCGELYQHCSLAQAASLSEFDELEESMFFKIQSIGSRNIEVFQHAFPTTPWIFVYRDPVQVMASHLEQGTSHANCVIRRHGMRGFGGGDAFVNHYLKEHNIDKHTLSDVEYCAVHLATITDTAVQALQSGGMGKAVNYASLPQILWEQVLPNHFQVKVTDEQVENMQSIAGVYSKGTAGRHGTFKDDTEKKDKKATPEMREASERFLQSSYEELLQYGF
eukprot:CAMPEP_0178938638 /NCGR_PEP_ID=MMETSP0786-20121207/26442_1 /TAXON_ID=186022 /ORGANISM="Thalassionema frauenfeldii, Strain CCMP 1798" /LENGTH=476 /DNA_ID=CAMNT_0020617379 /DNA_START=95 /DNA_END=1526 /DNA_ORIENTATION=-